MDLAQIQNLMTLAAFALLVAYNNISDYGSNFAFVQHVLSMDSVFPGNSATDRALTLPLLWNAGYWLIIAWAVILLIHAAGLAFLPFLMELEYRVLWVVVPTVSLLWMTRYIFGDNLDWDKTDKKGWKEGRMNYSQKSNKKNIGR